MRIGIVADDLTGAMDAAVPFADASLTTAVLLDGDAACEHDAAVLSIDTHSRDASPADAAQAVRAAIARVTAEGRLPFKKIDSTLRGNLGAEIGAALQASGRRCAIVAPAAPAQGRVLRGGRLFVDGAPVGDSTLDDMLRAAMPGVEVRRLAATQRPLAGEKAVVYVADAQSERELDRIAVLGLRGPEHILLAGSSGLGGALARRLCPFADAVVRAERRRYRRLWFVVGSYNARSAQQAHELLSAHDADTIVLPLADTPMARPRPPGPLALVHVEGLGGPPLADPKRVAQRLAQLTADLLGERPASGTALFMTGGDTARAILSRLQVRSISVIGSAAPGVVHATIDVAGVPLGIVTKAGGFGEPGLFVQLARDLLA